MVYSFRNAASPTLDAQSKKQKSMTERKWHEEEQSEGEVLGTHEILYFLIYLFFLHIHFII